MTIATQLETQDVKSEMCHFSVNGEFLTNHCRNLVVEGDWTHALNTLTEGLIGISVEYCYQILKGEKKLVGVNDLDFVDEDMESDEVKEYINQVNYMYGSVVKLSNSNNFKWFKPYAYVDNVGYDDMVNFKESTGRLPTLKASFNTVLMEGRISYYFNDRFKDVSFCASKLSPEIRNNFGTVMAFLFEPCESPPIWLPVNRDVEKSIEACIKCGIRLEDRGARQSDCAIDPFLASRDISSIVSPYVSEAAIKVKKKEYVLVIPIIPAKPEEDLKFKYECGWIMPDGRFFGCFYEGHVDLAEALLYHYCDMKLEDINNPAEIAESKNWCRVQVGIVGKDTMFSFKDYINCRCTKRVKETIFNYCEKWKKEFPAWQFID